MDMRAWERCAKPGLSLADVPRDTPVWMGLDLAQKRDFAALVVCVSDGWRVARVHTSVLE